MKLLSLRHKSIYKDFVTVGVTRQSSLLSESLRANFGSKCSPVAAIVTSQLQRDILERDIIKQ